MTQIVVNHMPNGDWKATFDFDPEGVEGWATCDHKAVSSLLGGTCNPYYHYWILKHVDKLLKTELPPNCENRERELEWFLGYVTAYRNIRTVRERENFPNLMPLIGNMPAPAEAAMNKLIEKSSINVSELDDDLLNQLVDLSSFVDSENRAKERSGK